MSSVEIFKGFLNILDEKSGRNVAKCAACETVIKDPKLLRGHMSNCPGSTSKVLDSITLNFRSAESSTQMIKEKIIQFFSDCSIPPGIIEHPAAIEMFKALRSNLILPTKEEILQDKMTKDEDYELNEGVELTCEPDSDVESEANDIKGEAAEEDVEEEEEAELDEEQLENSWDHSIEDSLAGDVKAIEEKNSAQEEVHSKRTTDKKRAAWQGFRKVFDPFQNRTTAQCNNCNKVQQNTSSERLIGHRNRCSGIDRTNGFTEEFDANKNRIVLNCNRCGQRFINNEQTKNHRTTCTAPELQQRNSRSLDWTGFSPVYDESSSRKHAKCDACGFVIRNCSRIRDHRLKCSVLISQDEVSGTANVATLECVFVTHEPSEGGKGDFETIETDSSKVRQPSTTKAMRWQGFTKIYDETVGRNVAQCLTCGGFIRNTGRISEHRLKCQPKSHHVPRPRNKEENWDGFSKVWNEAQKRKIAQCDHCNQIILNTAYSRLDIHRKKCKGR